MHYGVQGTFLFAGTDCTVWYHCAVQDDGVFLMHHGQRRRKVRIDRAR
jgi:hypothetical protein